MSVRRRAHGGVARGTAADPRGVPSTRAIRPSRRAAAVALGLTAALGVPAVAHAADPLVWWEDGEQQLLGRTPSGGMPNGVASEPTFSHDSRNNRWIAFTSTATNIDGPVAAGRRNVYLVQRGGAIKPWANPWQYGSTRLLTVGRGGAPANGDSWGPSISGFTGPKDKPEEARIVAFVSTATNLVRGAGDGRTPRAYVASVRGGGVRLVRAPGWVTGVEVSADAQRVFVTTTRGLYVETGRRVRKIASGSGMAHPATTTRGYQVAFERRGNLYLTTVASRRTVLLGPGTDPDVDAGEPNGPRRGFVRALTFSRDGGAFRMSFSGSRTKIEQFGVTQTASKVNSGGSTTAFGEGRQVRLQVRLLDGGDYGGYVRPQGVCPLGQGDVTSVAVSTRYNYTAFTCQGGGLFGFYVGPYE
jgi:hypothetical protein